MNILYLNCLGVERGHCKYSKFPCSLRGRVADWYRIDMDLPLLEILEIAKAHYPSEFVSPSLADDVEYYAPGYLAMEAQGSATEFDPEVLLEELR